ncbi:hypothetical protein [Actinoalloteichus caeruleus]|uniref:Uncharacterized protein n=1 Tax=Actinoalloteichus caeruleus DSM 43889 TaxID=1120930 RepID=A0ABT1JIK2_ACTCY|nr:hypothetical protein [Actinoalloteichus caeruleus]MCP2332298.1 hypothetical protein [Actinoalloteichus caeruleus DSM 43889]
MKTVPDWLLLAMLVLDAVVLALLALFFLPFRIGVVPVPFTAVLAGVTNVLLVLGAGRISGRMRVAGAPLFAWVLVVIVFGVSGPGGDVVLMGDWRGLLLLALGALPPAMVLGTLSGRYRASTRASRGGAAGAPARR